MSAIKGCPYTATRGASSGVDGSGGRELELDELDELELELDELELELELELGKVLAEVDELALDADVTAEEVVWRSGDRVLEVALGTAV